MAYQTTIDLEYALGDVVYENFEEGAKGIVINIHITLNRYVEYEVRWEDGSSENCLPEMLTATKVYVGEPGD